VLLLVASETGHVYTFATPKLQPLITKSEGKNLIQQCLNAPDGPSEGQSEEEALEDPTEYPESSTQVPSYPIPLPHSMTSQRDPLGSLINGNRHGSVTPFQP
jgi:pheromone receptor transcription factor